MTGPRDALSLGATLYVPATRADLTATLFGGRIAGLRSAVVCLEDSVRADTLPLAMARLAALLREVPAIGGPAVFVRPRHAALLEHIARLPGAERLAGYVLPKVTADTLTAYAAVDLAPDQQLMPTLETAEVFDPHEMHRLRDQLLVLGARVLALRIGGNDLLQLLGARRARTGTLYDGPLGPLIAQLVGTFAPHGFALSAPVMERFDDPHLLRDEMRRDIEHGLLTKTAIHPAQIPVIQAALTVSPDDLAEAEAMLDEAAPAVFAMGGAMAEPATHRRWATTTVRRAALFGIAEPLAARRRGDHASGSSEP